jgi:hypothetical protein
LSFFFLKPRLASAFGVSLGSNFAAGEGRPSPTCYDFGAAAALGLVSKVLEEARQNGEVGSFDLVLASEHFLFALVLGPMRRVVLGLDRPELSDARLLKIRDSVSLFLNGLHSMNAIEHEQR